MLDDALAKCGNMSETDIAEFKVAMMPFFCKCGISEDEIEVEEFTTWTITMTFPCKGKTESKMEPLLVDYFTSIGGSEDDQLLTLSDGRKGMFEWVVTLPACPQEVREATENDGDEQDVVSSDEEDAGEELSALLEGVRTGRLKSKTEDGYLVMQGEYYDDIEAGEKTVEFRELSEYNLKRTIGLKSIRLQRGYGHPGKPPKKMRWTVAKVCLSNDCGEECDPFDVPQDFDPNMIAIHLGKRID